MIDIKKRVLSVGLGLVFAVTCVAGDVCAGNGNNADETGKIVESYEIPREMQPLSEIEFISDHEYVIKKGAVAVKKEEPEVLDPGIVQAIKDGSWFTAICYISPPPVKGLKVDYATDGIVSHWKFPKESQDRMIEIPTTMDTLPKIYDKYLEKYSNNNEYGYNEESDDYVTFSGYKPPKGYKLAAHWDKNIQKIYKKKVNKKITKVVGIGRATTYNDKKGTHDNILVKGDVATQMVHDDCKFSTDIKLTTRAKNGKIITRNMKKRDIGALPHAVIDIWKTGVEKWGYKWHKQFSMPRQVKYYHE